LEIGFITNIATAFAIGSQIAATSNEITVNFVFPGATFVFVSGSGTVDIPSIATRLDYFLVGGSGRAGAAAGGAGGGRRCLVLTGSVPITTSTLIIYNVGNGGTGGRG
jgi:hypothetical protein